MYHKVKLRLIVLWDPGSLQKLPPVWVSLGLLQVWKPGQKVEGVFSGNALTQDV